MSRVFKVISGNVRPKVKGATLHRSLKHAEVNDRSICISFLPKIFGHFRRFAQAPRL